LLDDAFQHRYVKPGLSILLTDYHRLFCDDTLLPAGRLRESVNGKNRALLIRIKVQSFCDNIIVNRLNILRTLCDNDDLCPVFTVDRAVDENRCHGIEQLLSIKEPSI